MSKCKIEASLLFTNTKKDYQKAMECLSKNIETEKITPLWECGFWGEPKDSKCKLSGICEKIFGLILEDSRG